MLAFHRWRHCYKFNIMIPRWRHCGTLDQNTATRARYPWISAMCMGGELEIRKVLLSPPSPQPHLSVRDGGALLTHRRTDLTAAWPRLEVFRRFLLR